MFEALLCKCTHPDITETCLWDKEKILFVLATFSFKQKILFTIIPSRR